MSKREDKRIIRSWELVRSKGKWNYLMRYMLIGIGIGVSFTSLKIARGYINEPDLFKTFMTLEEIVMLVTCIVTGTVIGALYGNYLWRKGQAEYYNALGDTDKANALSKPNMFKRLWDKIPFKGINVSMAVVFTVMGLALVLYLKNLLPGYETHLEYIYAYARVITLGLSCMCTIKSGQKKWLIVGIIAMILPNVFIGEPLK